MIKRLEGIQKGQKVYLVPSDSRCTPQYAKYIQWVPSISN